MDKSFIAKFLTIFLFIVILLRFGTALIPTVADASNQLGDAQVCSNAGGYYNTTQLACLTNSSPTGLAYDYAPIALGNVSGGITGIVVLLIMSVLLLTIFGALLLHFKKK